MTTDLSITYKITNIDEYGYYPSVTFTVTDARMKVEFDLAEPYLHAWDPFITACKETDPRKCSYTMSFYGGNGGVWMHAGKDFIKCEVMASGSGGDGTLTVYVPTKEFLPVIEQMCKELFKEEE